MEQENATIEQPKPEQVLVKKAEGSIDSLTDVININDWEAVLDAILGLNGLKIQKIPAGSREKFEGIVADIERVIDDGAEEMDNLKEDIRAALDEIER